MRRQADRGAILGIDRLRTKNKRVDGWCDIRVCRERPHTCVLSVLLSPCSHNLHFLLRLQSRWSLLLLSGRVLDRLIDLLIWLEGTDGGTLWEMHEHWAALVSTQLNIGGGWYHELFAASNRRANLPTSTITRDLRRILMVIRLDIGFSQEVVLTVSIFPMDTFLAFAFHNRRIQADVCNLLV